VGVVEPEDGLSRETIRFEKKKKPGVPPGGVRIGKEERAAHTE